MIAARVPALSFVLLSPALFSIACASTPAPQGALPLTGCVIGAGPTAVCDDGGVILDVARVDVEDAAARIAAVHDASARGEDYTLEAGAAVDDDDVLVRVDTLRFVWAPATVGTVTFIAPRAEGLVVSCAAFRAGDANCRARAAALLRTTPTSEQTVQHKPALTLAPAAGCRQTDVPYAVQHLCDSGEKLSVVGIRGRYGPAAAAWLFSRVVQSQATQVRSFTTCPVLGQLGPCSVVEVGDGLALFGGVVEADELRLVGCFLAPGATGVPASCAPAFAPLGDPDPRRLITRFDVRFDGCALARPDNDAWDTSVVCAHGDGIAQIGDASSLPQGSGKPVPCRVRGAPATCAATATDGGRTVYRADVDDPRIDAFVCTSTEAGPAPICDGFIDAAD